MKLFLYLGREASEGLSTGFRIIQNVSLVKTPFYEITELFEKPIPNVTFLDLPRRRKNLRIARYLRTRVDLSSRCVYDFLMPLGLEVEE